MQWSFVAAGPVKADLEVPAGTIEVRPASGNIVEVGLEPLHGGYGRAERLIEESEVSFANDSLRVHVPAATFRNVALHCNVAVPAGSAVKATSASADVQCLAAVASVTVKTASGDVSCDVVEGDVSVTTASGDVACNRVAGVLRVKGASADVSVREVVGEVDIALASGDVEIGDAGSSVKLNTASGDLRLRRIHDGKVNVKSASGDVLIGVAPGVGAHLDVTSMTGEVTCTLPFSEESLASADVGIRCVTMSGDVKIEAAVL